jgi:hypothetical protein
MTELPVITYEEGWTFEEPPGYQPHFVDVGEGVVVDDARLPLVLNTLLERHSEGERIRADARKGAPLGLAMDRGPDGMVSVFVNRTGELVGAFDHRLLRA